MSVLDPAAAARLRRLGGDRLLRELIGVFHELGPARLAAVAEHARDWEQAERACHSLKSAAGNLGAHGLQRLAAEAEAAAGRRDEAALASLLPELDRAYEAAAAALRLLEQELEP